MNLRCVCCAADTEVKVRAVDEPSERTKFVSEFIVQASIPSQQYAGFAPACSPHLV